ncbi:hypothetical protein I79_000067 [Cricetulus griseus]|uniref:Uncharacterized protein n=1 Tax=Cricetulus griseus TaxID=10029 RepID=G3GRC4_CRIGR|nr:hypothetical protein I79_000067 [Cricetulus griseus]
MDYIITGCSIHGLHHHGLQYPWITSSRAAVSMDYIITGCSIHGLHHHGLQYLWITSSRAAVSMVYIITGCSSPWATRNPQQKNKFIPQAEGSGLKC